MELSLVLATYNNAGYLGDLLDGLVRCQHPDCWELIVVDNGSTDNTVEVVHEYEDRLPIKYLQEQKKGKSRALNHGLRHATGEVVLFTDDDVIPHPEWLINHIRVMRDHPDIKILGGKVLVDKTVLPVWLNRSWNLKGILASEHNKGEVPGHYAPGDYPFGPNMSVRRSSIACIDRPWPENIGPGTRLPVGDETAFCRNVLNLSVKEILYHPICIVEHRPRIGSNFLIASVRRCYLAGYSVALSGLPPTSGGRSEPFIRLVLQRLSRIGSIQEFVCIAARVTGYYWGRSRLGRQQQSENE